MTPTHEPDVGIALREAADQPTGLRLDPDAVLGQGRRAVQRRRWAAASGGVAALVVVAVVAAQIGGGPDRATVVPATSSTAPAPSATTVQNAATGPVNESAQVQLPYASTADPVTDGVRLTLTAQATGSVRETWTFYNGPQQVRTFTRTSPRTTFGRMQLLLPVDSGQPGVVAGYVDTGSDRSSDVSIAATGNTDGARGSTQRLVASGGTAQGTRYLFLMRATEPAHAALAVNDKVLGVVWQEADGADPLAPTRQRAALWPQTRARVLKTVLTDDYGDEWVVWRDSQVMGFNGVSGVVGTTTGQMQVLALRGVNLFGWYPGTDELKVESPGIQAWSVNKAEVGGYTAFLLTLHLAAVGGSVTVSAGDAKATIELAAR